MRLSAVEYNLFRHPCHQHLATPYRDTGLGLTAHGFVVTVGVQYHQIGRSPHRDAITLAQIEGAGAVVTGQHALSRQ